MDLVDIDQVLNNLELREAANEIEENKAVVALPPLTPDASSYGVAGASTSKNVAKTSNVNSKGFVGVSQVFNSLDDYRKNVESLGSAPPQKYDEECRPIGATTSWANIEAKELSVQNDTDCSRDKAFPTPKVVNSVGSVLTRAIRGFHEDVDDDDDDDEDEFASSDIHKYTEHPRTRFLSGKYDGDDATNSSSDSLTTSSSSNFSSGPSPGLTTDEHSTPLSPVDDEERSALLADFQGQQHLDLDEVEAVESIMNRIDGVPNEEASASGAAVEDLAVGLSSISLTTVNSQSNMPSSVLVNVLEDLSEPTTTSLLSQLRDDVDTNTKPVESRPSATGSESHIANEDNNEHENIEPPPCNRMEGEGRSTKDNKAPPLQEVIKIQQPITFSSTMDDISDTELDSMLQEMEAEMDIDDAVDFNARKASTTLAKENSAFQDTADPIIAANSKSPTEAVAIEDLASNCAADALNADSFSQASTVEFSEIKPAQIVPDALSVPDAQSVPEAQSEELMHSPNSVASSYTSSESSSLDDEIIGPDGENLGTHSRTRPKRPTTLDLPTLKISLYANAGQTPPGTNMAQSNAAEAEANILDVSEHNMEHSNSGNDAREDEVENDPEQNNDGESNEIAEASGYSDPHAELGIMPPIWVPDNMASSCMQCHVKFTMIKRRHHCRACGKVLCSVCCSQKFKLEFLNKPESRVCVQCYLILTQRQQTANASAPEFNGEGVASINDESIPVVTPTRSPNPNNPMEYCSTIPPHRQVSATTAQPPSVIVPVGVLKKDGSYSSNSSNSSGVRTRKRKSVMFSDGIAPGSDLATMEHQWTEAKQARRGHQQNDKSRNAGGNKPSTPAKSESSIDATTLGLVAQLFRGSIPPLAAAATVSAAQEGSNSKANKKSIADARTRDQENIPSAATKRGSASSRSRRLPPSGCDEYGSFIGKEDNSLPPIYISKDKSGRDFEYKDVANNFELIERLQQETLKFAVQKNFFVCVKIVNLKCCMNRTVINFTTCGMHHVGNDEVIILLEYELPDSKELMTEPPIPKDIFIHLDQIYREAELGNPIAELSYTSSPYSNFLGSREYGGFIFIRATFQCLQDVIVPENPFLIGVLIHRYEVPWAKVFPLRLMLRLGAQYRYYPCPHISIRNRESVYAEIAQTIINFLADFRNYSYTLPCIRGMYIHMEDRQTTVLIPRNRQEDVIKAINNSSDHILAFGGNFSKSADGHLVCMQNVNDERGEMYAYSTQAINIQGQPRKVTGASFFVLNEALKTSSGLSGKCSIVEDGLMVQILPAKMEDVRNALRNQKDIDIVCGPINAEEQQTEVVSIKWVENDRDFNIGVKSPIDDQTMEGVSSMRVHASFNYSNSNYSIRLTDIYLLKYDEWYNAAQASLSATSLDITRSAEQIARSASMALVPFLDLLAASGSLILGLRVTLHQDNVCYEAGARGDKLPPLYMNALDNHLIPTLHNESSGIEDAIILELIFYILNV